MTHRTLARLIVLAHTAYVAFVVCGCRGAGFGAQRRDLLARCAETLTATCHLPVSRFSFERRPASAASMQNAVKEAR